MFLGFTWECFVYSGPFVFTCFWYLWVCLWAGTLPLLWDTVRQVISLWPSQCSVKHISHVRSCRQTVCLSFTRSFHFSFTCSLFPSSIILSQCLSCSQLWNNFKRLFSIHLSSLGGFCSKSSKKFQFYIRHLIVANCQKANEQVFAHVYVYVFAFLSVSKISH